MTITFVTAFYAPSSHVYRSTEFCRDSLTSEKIDPNFTTFSEKYYMIYDIILNQQKESIKNCKKEFDKIRLSDEFTCFGLNEIIKIFGLTLIPDSNNQQLLKVTKMLLNELTE